MASQFYGEGLNISPYNFPQKVERKLKKKKKQKKEKKPKDEPRVFLGEWVEDGVESSSSSSDESIKSTPPAQMRELHHPTRATWPKVWIAM